MKTNAEVDFAIAVEDLDLLKKVQQIGDYGEHNKFPVYGKKQINQ